MRIILITIMMTQMGCSFVTSTAGSFMGNLGADLAYDQIKNEKGCHGKIE